LAIFQLILTKFHVYILTKNVLGKDGTPLFSTSGLVVIRLINAKDEIGQQNWRLTSIFTLLMSSMVMYVLSVI